MNDIIKSFFWFLLLVLIIGGLVFVLSIFNVDKSINTTSYKIHGIIIDIPNTNMTCSEVILIGNYYYCNIDNVTGKLK